MADPNLAPILQAGIGLFAGTTVISVAAFIYFIYATADVALSWSRYEYSIKMTRSTWLYWGAIAISFGACWLYIDQYFNQGFAVKPDMTIIVWQRWLFLSILFFLTTYTLGNVMSHQNDHPSKHEMVGGDSQAFYCNLFAFFSCIALYKATVSQSLEPSAVSAGVSVILFLMAVATLFFPRDMLWGDDYRRVRDIAYSEEPIWRVTMNSTLDKHHENAIVIWSFVYRAVLFLQWVLSYVAMLIVWFLADGQFFTDTLDLKNTMLAFLVCDAVFIVPFQLLLIVLTFKNVVGKVTVEDRTTGTVHFASQQELLMNAPNSLSNTNEASSTNTSTMKQHYDYL